MDDYIEHLNHSIVELHQQLEELHVEEWKRPYGQSLLRQLDRYADALCLADAYAKGRALAFDH